MEESRHTNLSYVHVEHPLIAHCSPEFLLGPHEGDLVPDGLDEAVVAGDGARHHRELAPVVPDEDGEHGGHLVLQARRELQLQTLLRLKTDIRVRVG